MQTNKMRLPHKFFLAAVGTLILLTLAYYFNGAFDEYGDSNTRVSTSTIQTIETGTDNDGMEDEHAFLQADYNFDGYPDRLEILDCGATGNCSYQVLLYDVKTKTYLPSVDATVPEEKLTYEVTNPTVNKAEKLVCSYANVGASGYHMSIYKYSVNNNTYALVKEVSGNRDAVHGCTLK